MMNPYIKNLKKIRRLYHTTLFMALQNGGLLNDDHEGGCVLYEKRTQVEVLLGKQTRVLS